MLFRYFSTSAVRCFGFTTLFQITHFSILFSCNSCWGFVFLHCFVSGVFFFSSVKSISKNQNLATLQSTVDHVVKQTLRVSWFGQRWSSDCVLFVWFVFSQCNVHHHGLSALSTPMNEWMNAIFVTIATQKKKKQLLKMLMWGRAAAWVWLGVSVVLVSLKQSDV